MITTHLLFATYILVCVFVVVCFVTFAFARPASFLNCISTWKDIHEFLYSFEAPSLEMLQSDVYGEFATGYAKCIYSIRQAHPLNPPSAYTQSAKCITCQCLIHSRCVCVCVWVCRLCVRVCVCAWVSTQSATGILHSILTIHIFCAWSCVLLHDDRSAYSCHNFLRCLSHLVRRRAAASGDVRWPRTGAY